MQVYFFPLVLAFSAIISASLAEDILSGALPFASLYYAIPASILLSLLFFAFPLFLFSNKLRESRIKGMHDYMTMAAHYSQFFEQRWIKEHSESSRSQLGSADIQSLADLTNSINVIRDMRIVPVSRELILAYVAAVLIPYIPFLFIRFSFNDILLQLFQIIAG